MRIPDWKIPAHVIATIPTADRQKATVKVRIGFDQLDPRILPDMGVKVALLRDPEPAGAGAERAAHAAAEGGHSDRSMATRSSSSSTTIGSSAVRSRWGSKTAIRSKCSPASRRASGWSSKDRHH